jgi:hypothetical protein
VTVGKSIDALIKGPLAAQSVDQLMDDLQIKRTKLRSRIHLLNSRRQFWSSKDAESGVQQGGLLLSSQAEIQDQVDGTARNVGNMAKSIESMFHKTQEIHTTTQGMYAMMQQERERVEAREAILKKQAVCNKFLALFYDSHKKQSKLRKYDLRELGLLICRRAAVSTSKAAPSSNRQQEARSDWTGHLSGRAYEFHGR